MANEKTIKVLMFGWEFPPFASGGLGTACYGLTKGLSRSGKVQITFVLPSLPADINEEHMKILTADELGLDKSKIKFKTVNSVLRPYTTSRTYSKEKFGLERASNINHEIYGRDLFEEVERYAQQARVIAEQEDFDIIHCHDWLTYPCGIEAKKVSARKGKKVPLIAHIHATEFDRTIGHPNPQVYEIEKRGMDSADYVISVSNYTKNMVVRHYGIKPEKILVVHNSIEPRGSYQSIDSMMREHHKIVLFLGRITVQKGPDHFLWVARRVLELDDSIRFVMVGNGDMFPYIIEEAANLGIGDKVLFADFVSGDDVDKAYRMADVYVMPSISEPFGITALEAIANGTPAIISKQSGVSEIVRNCLVADFWDTDEMANKILAVLNYPALRETLVEEGFEEVRGFSWDTSAQGCIDVYRRAISEVCGL